MSTATEKTTVTVALVGNPNTGKSTLFNALAGVRQRVGNYPGVTVEKKIGHLHLGDRRVALVDLPGTYSLAPRSPDEMVAVDVLLGRQRGTQTPEAVLCIVDGSNLERNLYLVSQVLEMGLPTVVAVNMTDVAAARDIAIDYPLLGERLGVSVVAIQANRKQGLEELRRELAAAIEREGRPPESPFPEAFRQEVAGLQAAVEHAAGNGAAPLPRYLVERLLLDTSGYLEEEVLPERRPELREQLLAARERLAEAGLPIPAVEAISRYGWVAEVLKGVIQRPSARTVTFSDRLDRVLTHKLAGTAIFAVLMLVVFGSVFSLAEYPMGLIESAQGWLAEFASGSLAEGPFQSLVVDGVIAGVGGVLVFLPQIFILFFFIAVLEDCGYMARAAYLMDKLMSKVGLSGKSFIPLLSSFACAIPGVMAARVIENRRDRLVTILVAPLMSCAARLPVYTLLIAAFIPATVYVPLLLTLPGLTMFAMYTVGIFAAVFVALVLKKTILKGETPPFVMELPSYKFPSLATVLHRMFDRGWAFVRRAGTLIFAVSIVVWAAAYYPRNTEQVEGPFQARLEALQVQLAALPEDDPQRESLEEQQTALNNEIDGAHLRQSFLGRAGQYVEPVVRPLGWDWRIGSAAIASFPAREVIVGTLGVIYNLGGEEDDQSPSLRKALHNARWDGTDRPVYNVPVALSIMVFFALCAQCAATLAVIKRETNSWWWPVFTFGYMTGLAYVAALATYQVGMMVG